MSHPARVEDHAEAAADLNQMVVAVVIASTLGQDNALRRKFRRYASCPDDQSLILELPVSSAGLELRPDGSIHPVRAARAQPMTNFERLIAQNPELRQMVELARPRITKAVQATILPFLLPGALPSRDEFIRLERWAPLVEVPAYRFCARALGELDAWRDSALAEATEGISSRETVLARYYALIHTVGHFTLICSGPGTTPWLSDMAKSSTWKEWTPSFPLVRERTLWLAAAGARAAIAFGAGVVDRYADVLTRATHVTPLVDALYGLTAIGLSDGNVRESIVGLIAAEGKVATRRLITGTAFAEAAFRSATNCLAQSEIDPTAHHDLLDRLSWQPASLHGLGTREAFRLDPMQIDETGQVIGFRALPHILRAKVPFHYPLRPRGRGPFLPTLDEMPLLLTRAWEPRSQVRRTIH